MHDLFDRLSSAGPGELARELLLRLAEDAEDAAGDAVYRDPGSRRWSRQAAFRPACWTSPAMRCRRCWTTRSSCSACSVNTSRSRSRTCGSIQKARVRQPWSLARSLDRRTRMMFDEQHIFINGESYRASGRDAQLMRRAGRPSAGWRG
jgi:50S ribosomal protein L16 3-hydroxylase